MKKNQTELWTKKRLKDVAEIRVSNVDKKTYTHETPVLLCNYMDVYSNEYIENDIDFMEASATEQEVQRFGLKLGDVLITKDSESPDDIGVPAVVRDSMAGVVCGYHLAMIRLKQDEIDPVFLGKYLTLNKVTRYFSVHASGSTRFGLPIRAIEEIPLEFPSKREQVQIGKVLLKFDKAIKQAEANIVKQQKIKAGLTQDLFTNGIDDDGNIRSEKTHEFKNSPVGRIPRNWICKSIEELMVENVISAVQDGNHGEIHPKSSDFVDEGIPFIMANDIKDGRISEESCKKISYKQYKSLRIGFSKPGDILLSHKASIGFVALVPEHLKEIMLTPQVTYYRLVNQEIINKLFLFHFFKSDKFQYPLKSLAKQSTRDYIGILAQRNLRIAYPINVKEQEKITQILEVHEAEKNSSHIAVNKLKVVRESLKQDLLTGKVRVTDLLNQPH